MCFVHKLKSNFTPDPTVVLVAGTARRATSLPVIDLDQMAITLRKEATYAGHPVPDRGSASE